MKTRVIIVCSVLVAAISCDKEKIQSPYYWSDLFLNMYANELVIGDLEPGPAPLAHKRTVLLITGVTIKAKWFDPIVARLRRDGFEPVVYEPPALLSGSLFQAARDLADVVAKVRADSGQDKIDILAECTGGVIARYYVHTLGGDKLVNRLVTFVSPHHGIDRALMAAKLAGWPALYDLSPGSAFLLAVNAKPTPKSVKLTSIYTCADEYITPYQTSIVEGAKNIGLCDETVGHFQTFYDPKIYLIMHKALTEGDTPASGQNQSIAPSTVNPNGSASNTGNAGTPAEDVSGDGVPNVGCSAAGMSSSSTSATATGLWILLATLALVLLRRRKAAPLL
ncbi:MAG: hypothetical protein KC503_42430 [Myxococcales bacterium]|nr:hypothetical protein [Myxococcales bacterium]